MPITKEFTIRLEDRPGTLGTRSGTKRSEAERGLPARDGTMDQQRLGGAVPGAFSATQAAE